MKTTKSRILLYAVSVAALALAAILIMRFQNAEIKNKQPEVIPEGQTRIEEKTIYEKERKKLTDNINVLEFSAFDNRNSIIYTTVDKGDVSLYAADIDKKYNMSRPFLLDKETNEGSKIGIRSLSTGKMTEACLYLSGKGDNTVIRISDISAQTKKDLAAVKDKGIISNAVFDSIDNRVVYAKQNTGADSIEIASNSLGFNNENILFSLGASSAKVENPVTWIDMSKSESKVLYCLKDAQTENPVLWLYDLKEKKAMKLTDSDKHVLTAKWSKDENKIAYSVLENDNTANIFLFEVSTNTHKQVTTGKGRKLSPGWSYFENRILYMEEENGINNLYATGLID